MHRLSNRLRTPHISVRALFETLRHRYGDSTRCVVTDNIDYDGGKHKKIHVRETTSIEEEIERQRTPQQFPSKASLTKVNLYSRRHFSLSEGRSFHPRRNFSLSNASEDPEYRAIKQNILRYFAAVHVGCCIGYVFEKKNMEEAPEELKLQYAKRYPVGKSLGNIANYCLFHSLPHALTTPVL